MSELQPLLDVRSLVKQFDARPRLTDRLTRRPRPRHRAVDDVSFTAERGEILGIAGGSGSGKTTLARCLVRLIEVDSGEIRVNGIDIRSHRGAELRELRRRMQIVFQDPYSSLNPRMTVGDALHEAGRVHRRPGSDNRAAFVAHLLDLVQLTARFADRRPHELSGGQLQRASIARALAVTPEILIADEAVSALDVSVQAQLLNLFRDLRENLGVTVLFISHQLAVIAEVADRVAVMKQGSIVESGATHAVFGSPSHEYTRALLDAHPHPDPSARRAAG